MPSNQRERTLRRLHNQGETLIAVDTEFFGAHSLTIQLASRLTDEDVALQIYHSPAIPGVPRSLDLSSYLPTADEAYGRFVSRFQLRRPALITPDLTPVQYLNDLFRLRLAPLSLEDGRIFRDAPKLKLVIVGHFLQADFCRLFGSTFYADTLSTPGYRVSDGKLVGLEACHGRYTDTQPVVQFARNEDDRIYQVTLRFRDTILPYGRGSLDSFSQVFLGQGKIDAITSDDKANMEETFRRKTADAYGYAAVDVVNTLLIHEQMETRDRQIYRSFDTPEEQIPELRSTLGRRVSDFLVQMTFQSVARESQCLSTERALRDVMMQGTADNFRNPRTSRYGSQTGGTHGGLLYSRSPTRFWHAAPGQFRDVDMSGCYNRILAGYTAYWGRPVVFEPGSRGVPLRDAVSFLRDNSAAGGWYVRVTGDMRGFQNTLVPSTRNAITPEQYRQYEAQLSEQDTDQIDLKDYGAKLYSARIESGIISEATWSVIQAMPDTAKEQYESLIVDSMVFYPASLVAQDGRAFDELVRQHQGNDLPWQAEIDLERYAIQTVEDIDDRYVSLAFPIGEYAERIGELRRQAQAESGRGSGADTAYKLQANTMFGVTVSPYFCTGNTVLGNQITSTARAAAYLMFLSLNGFQVITDGCSYRRDQIPACTFEECLEICPDYAVRRPDEHSGVPFIDPSEIPEDDEEFTDWYREHVCRFWQCSSEGFRDLLNIHPLEHKLTAGTESPSFDALGLDGSGNYWKCLQDGDAWRAADAATRGYGRNSKLVLNDWIVDVYSSDNFTELPPVTEDLTLLKYKEAVQRAKRAHLEGYDEILLPLGFAFMKVLNYRIIKPSAFVFLNPNQSQAISRQMDRFRKENACGLEGLALRRSYGRRRQGSLADVAEAIYESVRAGEHDLTRRLNLTRGLDALAAMSRSRTEELARCKEAALQDLWTLIDKPNHDPEIHLTGIYVKPRRG